MALRMLASLLFRLQSLLAAIAPLSAGSICLLIYDFERPGSFFFGGFCVLLMATLGGLVGSTIQKIQCSQFCWTTPELAGQLRKAQFYLGAASLALLALVFTTFSASKEPLVWTSIFLLSATAYYVGTVAAGPVDLDFVTLQKVLVLWGLMVLGSNAKEAPFWSGPLALVLLLLTFILASKHSFSPAAFRRLGLSAPASNLHMGEARSEAQSPSAFELVDGGREWTFQVRSEGHWRRAFAYERNAARPRRRSLRASIRAMLFFLPLVLLHNIYSGRGIPPNWKLTPEIALGFLGLACLAVKACGFLLPAVMKRSLFLPENLPSLHPLSRKGRAKLSLRQRRIHLLRLLCIFTMLAATLEFLTSTLGGNPVDLLEIGSMLRPAAISCLSTWIIVTARLQERARRSNLVPTTVAENLTLWREAGPVASLIASGLTWVLLGLVTARWGPIPELSLLLILTVAAETSLQRMVYRSYATADLV